MTPFHEQTAVAAAAVAARVEVQPPPSMSGVAGFMGLPGQNGMGLSVGGGGSLGGPGEGRRRTAP